MTTPAPPAPIDVTLPPRLLRAHVVVSIAALLVAGFGSVRPHEVGLAWAIAGVVAVPSAGLAGGWLMARLERRAEPRRRRRRLAFVGVGLGQAALAHALALLLTSPVWVLWALGRRVSHAVEALMWAGFAGVIALVAAFAWRTARRSLADRPTLRDEDLHLTDVIPTSGVHLAWWLCASGPGALFAIAALSNPSSASAAAAAALWAAVGLAAVVVARPLAGSRHTLRGATLLGFALPLHGMALLGALPRSEDALWVTLAGTSAALIGGAALWAHGRNTSREAALAQG